MELDAARMELDAPGMELDAHGRLLEHATVEPAPKAEHLALSALVGVTFGDPAYAHRYARTAHGTYVEPD